MSHVLDDGAHWRHLANMMDVFVRDGNAGCIAVATFWFLARVAYSVFSLHDKNIILESNFILCCYSVL